MLIGKPVVSMDLNGWNGAIPSCSSHGVVAVRGVQGFFDVKIC